MNEYWPGTIMIVIMNDDPYFTVATKDGLVSIADSVFNLNKKTSDKYACLVKKFL